MTCTQKRERENERTRQSRSFSCSGFAKRLDFSTTKNALRIKKRIVFFTSKAHPAVIKNDMVK